MTSDELQSLLKEHKLSIRKAAAIVGVHPSHLWRMTQGKRNITVDRAELIKIRLILRDIDVN